ncbi:MAG: TonB-dependent receptor, partial [Lutibacter sp.]
SALFVENSLDYTESINQEISSESKYSSLEQENMAIGAQLISKWNSNFSSHIQTYVTKYLINSANSDLLNDQTLFQNNEVLETGFKINTTYNLKNNLKFLNGYEFSELGITNAEEVNKPVYLKSIKNVEREHAIFSELNFTSKNGKTFITSGLRLNFNEKFGTFLLEPRLQFLQKINSNFSLKLAGEFKSQTATQIIDLQEDFLGVEKRRWVLSDNKLIPIIKSKQASAGIHYKKNNLFVDLEAFQKKVSGITTSNQGFQNQNQYIKTSGDYFVNGIEFLINKKTDNYSAWVGYTYNNNTYNFPALSPSKFPNNVDVRHAISYGNTYSIHNLSLALGITWRTGKPHTTPFEDDPINFNGIGNFINYNSPNSERLPNYFRADFSATYKFDLTKNIHSFVGVSILNLLNNKNTLNTHYTISNNNEITTISNYSIKTTPDFTFRIMF